MDKMTCSNCGKEIKEKPCPDCGSDKVSIDAHIEVGFKVGAELRGEVVKGSSEVAIEKEGETQKIPFYPGVSSDHIVNASLDSGGVSGVTPQYVKNQLIYNIDSIEKYANDTQFSETIDEHSFEINLGIFKYKYKRTIAKP